MSEHLTAPARNQERRLSDGLDFYKLTMGQLALQTNPDTQVTFALKNRAESRPLGEYVDIHELQRRFDMIRDQGFSDEEIAYLASLEAENGTARFSETYLDYLADLTLTDVTVSLDNETDELAVSATGPWANVSLWETVVMSELNELYYQTYIKKNGINIEELLTEGDRRLDEKIALLSCRPDIQFSDFGTRRRFSATWHEHVLNRLISELPDNFSGTSNPWYAHKLNVPPIGTYAHEMPMVYAALRDEETGQPLKSHRQMIDDWYAMYGQSLSIALTDTFTSNFFFADFTLEQAREWKGLRHDSGDPIEFGERAIAFYNEHSIDPTTKTIIFSDGLDITTIIRLADRFSDRINLAFGWGTSLMNDLGLPINNFVMKATKANGVATVKLSDTTGKHTGPADKIHQYTTQVEERLDAREAATITLGSRFHEEWRKSRPRTDEPGMYKPRMKPTTDEVWRTAHNGANEVDIANTNYEDLPVDWQADNKAAAVTIVELISELNGNVDLNDPDIYSKVGHAIHNEWLRRNSAWAPEEQKLSFDELSQIEKDKDINQMRIAKEVFGLQ